MKEQTLFDNILNAVNFESAISFLAPDICQYLSCERITLYQKGRDDTEIVSRFKTGLELREIRVPIGPSSIAGYVALSQQPLYFDDVYQDAELIKIHPKLTFDKSFDQQSGFLTKAMIAVPIKNNQVLLGVLQVLNHIEGGAFSKTEAKRALHLAQIIGQKFGNDLNASANPYAYLVQQQYITAEQLQAVERRAARLKIHPSHILIKDLQIDPLIIGKSMEYFYQVPYQPYDPKIIIPRELLQKLSKTYIRKQLCIPIAGNSEHACIALDNPSDYQRILELQRALDVDKITLRVSLPIDILRFLDLSAPNGEQDLSSIVGELHEQINLNDAELYAQNYPLVNSEAPPIIKLVDKIITEAIKLDASDIHIEPGKEQTPTTVRMRIDGICREIEQIPAQYSEAVLSRIKIISRLDIAEHRKPQDGKCKHILDGKQIELRVATIPTVNGESAVLRILSNANALALDKLQLSPSLAPKLVQLVEQPHGIFLVVGPTGSGKTTTLHALIGHLNTPEKKIWTVEDPVEITQAGLQQVQIMPKIGFGFAAALRSFLRADPDIILIGEIRDSETAEIGIEASLTGHLVLSTLHTNSAAETIVRLLDLGIEPLNFADALLGILAQRLMRTLCKHCKHPYHPDEHELEKLKRLYGKGAFAKLDIRAIKQQLSQEYPPEMFSHLKLESNSPILFRASGCEHCDNTGYKGRIGIHELLTASAHLKALISKRASMTDIKNLATTEGMLTLAQDGVIKILHGHSDLAQLQRVVIGE